MARALSKSSVSLLALIPLAASLGVAGCAFESGKGFGTLTTEVSSTFAGLDDDSGRLQPDSWYQTDNGFELLFDTLQLTHRQVTLLGPAAGSASPDGDCRFDPADPPPGCALCHNGHCHCGDALKDYDELQHEMCGQTSDSEHSELAHLELHDAHDLLGSGTQSTLDNCSATGDARLATQSGPDCELDTGSLSLVQLLLEELHLKARLRDGTDADRLGGQVLQVEMDWSLGGAPFARRVDPAQPVDHKSAAQLSLALALPVTAQLFDGIAWETLHRDGTLIPIDVEHNTPAGAQIIGNLSLSTLGARITRDDETWTSEDPASEDPASTDASPGAPDGGDDHQHHELSPE